MECKVRSSGSAPDFGVTVQFLIGTWSPEIGIGARSSEFGDAVQFVIGSGVRSPIFNWIWSPESNFKMDSGVRGPILKWILESGVQF